MVEMQTITGNYLPKAFGDSLLKGNSIKLCKWFGVVSENCYFDRKLYCFNGAELDNRFSGAELVF